jgi:hypothetical protein
MDQNSENHVVQNSGSQFQKTLIWLVYKTSDHEYSTGWNSLQSDISKIKYS